jgi:ankyrin repeat protein
VRCACTSAQALGAPRLYWTRRQALSPALFPPFGRARGTTDGVRSRRVRSGAAQGAGYCCRTDGTGRPEVLLRRPTTRKQGFRATRHWAGRTAADTRGLRARLRGGYAQARLQRVALEGYAAGTRLTAFSHRAQKNSIPYRCSLRGSSKARHTLIRLVRLDGKPRRLHCTGYPHVYPGAYALCHMTPPTTDAVRLNDACSEPDSPEARRFRLNNACRVPDSPEALRFLERLDQLGYYSQHDCGHVVRLLCTSGGCDVNATLGESRTRALHHAAFFGACQSLRVLLEHGADWTAEDVDGCSALHIAAEQGHTEVVRVLLEHGADWRAEDKDGCNALHIAAEEGHTEVVRALLERGADWSEEYNSCRVDAALFVASESGHIETVKLLLDWVADPRACADAALCEASKHGHLETVELLLDRGADMRARDDYALCIACENGHLEVVRLLLERGANMHARAGAAMRGSTRKGHTSITEILTEHGLNLLKLDARSVITESTQCSTEDVPDTVFAGNVLSLLSVGDRGRCACVSQRWQRLSETPSANAFLRFERGIDCSVLAQRVCLAGSSLRSFFYDAYECGRCVDVKDVLSAIRQSPTAASTLEILELRDEVNGRYYFNVPETSAYEIVDADQLSGLIADFPSLRRLCLNMTIPCALLPTAVKLIPFEGEWTVRVNCGRGEAEEGMAWPDMPEVMEVSDDNFRAMCEALQTDKRVQALVVYPPGWVRPEWFDDNRVKQLVGVLAHSTISVLDISEYGVREDGAFALATALDNEDVDRLVLNDRRSFSSAAYAALQKHTDKVQFEDEDDEDSDLDNPHSDMFMGWGNGPIARLWHTGWVHSQEIPRTRN